MRFREELEKLDLPKGEYALFGSAILAVRGIRENKDLDVAVTRKLFHELSKKYGDNSKGLISIGNIEFFSYWGDHDFEPCVKDAEIIDGLPFAKIEYYLEFKRKRGKPKDLKDIELIEEFLSK